MSQLEMGEKSVPLTRSTIESELDKYRTMLAAANTNLETMYERAETVLNEKESLALAGAIKDLDCKTTDYEVIIDGLERMLEIEK